MSWPYPAENEDPWFDGFEDLIAALDASGYASREDRNLIMGRGGIVSFSAGTGLLSWDSPLEIYSTIKGFIFTIPVGSVSLQEGELFYVDLVRAPTGEQTVVPVVASQVPASDTAFVVGIRRETDVFFRFGKKIGDGESFSVFEGGAGGGALSDTFERESTFAIPDGSSTTVTATVGRVIYPGSIIGLSLEITEPVNSGTIDVTVKINGSPAITTQLNTTFPSSRQITVATGTYQVVADDAITVEAVPASYDNISGLDGGLTANIAFLAGVDQEPAAIPDASSTQKGLTKLSTAPAIATDPIAVGDNDPRVDTWTQTGTEVRLQTLTDTVRIGTNANPPAAPYDLLIGRSAAGPSLVQKGDEVGGVETQMYTSLLAEFEPGGWMGTVSNHPFHLFTNNSRQFSVTAAGDIEADRNAQKISTGIFDFGTEHGGAGANGNYIEGGAGSAAAVSAASKGRIRYNQSTQKWEVSENGGAYTEMLGFGTQSYERHSSYGVAPGLSTQEATLGRVIFSGSIIGLSVHTEDARTAGSITVNVKKNGVTQFSVVIDGTNPEWNTSTQASGTYTVAAGDEITVEVVADASYDNVGSVVTGLVANVTLNESTASADVNVALLDAAQTFTAGQAIAQVTLTDGVGIVVDGDLSNNFQLELTQNSTLANPINVVAGMTINIAIRQDGTGGYTCGFGPAFLFPGGAPTITAGASKEDIISCYVRAEAAGVATVMLCSIAQDHVV
jgi:hypothetical protein